MTHPIMAVTYTEQLARHKESVAALYRLCARGIPKEAQFWITLAKQKDDHVEVLRQIKDFIKQGQVEMHPDSFCANEIEISIQYVDKLRRIMGAKDLTMTDALEVAWTIETTTAERKAFHVFDQEASCVSEGLAEIHLQEKAHLEMLSQRRSEARKHGIEYWVGRLMSFMDKGES